MAAASKRTESLNRKVSEATVHPSGKAMATVARGEVLVRSMGDDTPTQRVTRGHAREQHIAWSPDGHTLYYSTDEDGHETIRMATVRLSRKDLAPEEEEATENETKTLAMGMRPLIHK